MFIKLKNVQSVSHNPDTKELLLSIPHVPLDNHIAKLLESMFPHHERQVAMMLQSEVLLANAANPLD